MKLLIPLLGVASLLPLAASAQVGVGTTTPNAKAALDITATGKGLLIPRMDSATRVAIASPPTGLMVFQTSPRVGFYYYAGGSWLFLPDKARSGDNLGNHTATQNLVLNGNALRLRTASDGYHGLQYAGSPTDGPSLYGYGGGSLGFSSSGSVQSALSWDNNGLITIPQKMLLGSAGGNTGSGPDLALGGSGSGEGIGSVRTGSATNQYGIDFYTSFARRMVIANDGKVGIGTTSPNRPLAVQAAANSTELLSLNDNTGATKWHYNLGGGGLNLAESGVADNRLFVQFGGNVGIGVGNPSSRLDVAGTARLRGLTTAGYVTTAADGTLSSVAIPTAAAPAWSLTGNAGTDASTNFIGTTDGQDFVFKTNNAEVARFTQNGALAFNSQTVAVGGGAGALQPAGNTNLNVFVGLSAGGQNPGRNNAMLGGFAGRNSAGDNNTLLGAEAAQQLGAGSGNTVVGNNALRTATTGTGNVALGNYTGAGLGSGTNNTFLGTGADAATTGATLTNATAIGAGATVGANNSLILGGTGSNAVSVGIGNTAPTSTLQVSGTVAVGVPAVAPGASGAGTSLATYSGGFLRLNPTAGNANNYFVLPNPTTCAGRVYYLRNVNDTYSAYVGTASGSIYGASGSAALTAPYELKPNTTSKTTIAISDGVNWTIGSLN